MVNKFAGVIRFEQTSVYGVPLVGSDVPHPDFNALHFGTRGYLQISLTAPTSSVTTPPTVDAMVERISFGCTPSSREPTTLALRTCIEHLLERHL
jgi:hypothetical protein